MSRSRHPKKAVEQAVQYAEARGWRVELSSGKGHTWGKLFCPHSNRDGCILGVYCTPRNEDNHARQLRSKIDRCHHAKEDDQTEPADGEAHA